MANDPYSLGSINVDAAKELFAFLGQVYPFVDETAKDEYAKKVAALDTAGNPNEDTSGANQPAAPTAPAAETETPAEETTATEETDPNAHGASSAGQTPETMPAPEGATAIGTGTANEPPADAEVSPDTQAS